MEDHMPQAKSRVRVRIIQGKQSLIGRTESGAIGLLARDTPREAIRLGEEWEVDVAWVNERYFIFYLRELV